MSPCVRNAITRFFGVFASVCPRVCAQGVGMVYRNVRGVDVSEMSLAAKVAAAFLDGRKSEVERTALPDFGFMPNLAVVALDDVFDNGQAEASAALFARTGFIHAIEPFEDAVHAFGRDAGAVVAHADFDHAIFNAGIDPDRAFGAAIFDRVVDQIKEDLLEAIGVGQDFDVFGNFIVEDDFAFGRARLEIIKNVLGKVAELDRLLVQDDLARFEARDGEKVFDKEGEAVGMLIDGFEEAIVRVGIIFGAVEERFYEAFNERERSAEFVRDV